MAYVKVKNNNGLKVHLTRNVLIAASVGVLEEQIIEHVGDNIDH